MNCVIAGWMQKSRAVNGLKSPENTFLDVVNGKTLPPLFMFLTASLHTHSALITAL